MPNPPRTPPIVAASGRVVGRAVARSATSHRNAAVWPTPKQREDERARAGQHLPHFDPQPGHELGEPRRLLVARDDAAAVERRRDRGDAPPWRRAWRAGAGGACDGARSVIVKRHSVKPRNRRPSAIAEDAVEQQQRRPGRPAACSSPPASSSASLRRSAPVPSGSKRAKASRYSIFWPTMLAGDEIAHHQQRSAPI